MSRPRPTVIRNFDDFVEEAGMLPDLSAPAEIHISNPLELYFMQVADKHGILDRILDQDEFYEGEY